MFRRLGGAVRTIVIYSLLLGGSAVFALPFIWMVGTSFKVDREMFGEKITLYPARPVPAQVSPYLDARYFPEPERPEYIRVRVAIQQELAARTTSVSPQTWNRDEAVGILTPGIFKRLEQTLPRERWRKTDAELLPAVRAKIDDEMVAEVTRNVQRALTFGTVRVRSVDVQEQDVTADQPISKFWKLESEVARLVDDENSNTPQATLVYDFSAAGKQSITLSRVIELPFQADRLSRIQLSMTPDDSWHAFEFEVEKNGHLYRGVRPEFTGRFLPKAVTLQEWGPDDAPDSNKIKLWLPYKKVAEGTQYESDPNKVKVTMTLTESSQLDAWWAKCHRNYREALNYIPFWRYATTSIFLVILNILGNLLSCSLAAYAFARLQWPGRNLSFGVMLATMMIPPQVTMIPFFLIIKSLGWYNTLKPLWIISFFGNAFNIFLLRQFMKGIPRDLEDAAKIDGCNFLHIYWYVIMPLIRPTLACIAIFTFMAVWNDFMGPLIYLADQRLYPLSLGLYAFQVQKGGDYGMMMASSLLMTLPVIIIFFFAQRYFIQGIALTGTKG